MCVFPATSSTENDQEEEEQKSSSSSKQDAMIEEECLLDDTIETLSIRIKVTPSLLISSDFLNKHDAIGTTDSAIEGNRS